MKLLLIFIYISIFVCQVGLGFRLPSPLDYYNYERRQTTTQEEPTGDTQNIAISNDVQVQRILKVINDGLQELKRIPINFNFTQEIVDVNSLASTLPTLTITRLQ